MAQRSLYSRRPEWSQVRVGIFIIISLGLLAYAVYRVGDLFDVFADRYPLVTLLNRADGLLEGAPVTLAGQRVGQVEAIDFLPMDRPENLSVTLEINEDVQEHIRADSYARVRTQGLLGDKYVDIAPGSPGQRILEAWDTIPGIDPIDMEDLFLTANRTLREAGTAITELRAIIASIRQGEGTLGRLLVDDELYQRIAGAATEFELLLAEMSGQDGTIARLIRDPALYEQLVSAVARVDSIAGIMLNGEGTLGRLLVDDSLYQGLLGVVGRADTTIAALGGSFGALTEGEGTLQRLLTDPMLYDQLLKAVVDLQTLIADIRTNPRRFRPEIKVDIF